MDPNAEQFNRLLRQAIAELNSALFIGPEFSDLSLTNATKNIRLAQVEIARRRNVRIEEDTEKSSRPINGRRPDAR